jgi:hypothetical protein
MIRPVVVILVTLTILALVSPSFAGVAMNGCPVSIENSTPPPVTESAVTTPQDLIGRSGCCSWHGGVCGCEGGRVVCCDGVYSPTCTCHADGPA